MIWRGPPSVSGIFILLVLCFHFAEQSRAEEEPKLGLKGYDPVSYFTDGRPTPGKAEYSYILDDVRYQFSSADHLALFEADPDRYAPQYRGLCAMGLGAKGYKVEANPENWVIHNGRLYVTQRSFGPLGFKRAPEKWARLAATHVRTLETAPVGTGISWW